MNDIFSSNKKKLPIECFILKNRSFSNDSFEIPSIESFMNDFHRALGPYNRSLKMCACE